MSEFYASLVPNSDEMRPLVAACAACISAICVQPLDTMYLQRQLQTRSERTRLTHPMAGCTASGGAAFVKTGIYFSLYEYGLETFASMGRFQVPVAVFLGTSAANVPGTYLSVRKKRLQAHRNGMVAGCTSRLSVRQWIHLYLLSNLNKYPKNALKYVVYEMVLSLMAPTGVQGLVAGLVSSVVANTLFEPLEAARSYQSLGLRVTRSNLFNGVHISFLSTTIANTLGHGILEAVCPR